MSEWSANLFWLPCTLMRLPSLDIISTEMKVLYQIAYRQTFISEAL